MFKNLTISSLLILPLWLHAQTAGDYLHGGAQDYIFGKEDSAKAKLTEGVRRFPDDAQIRAVLALIREEQKSKQSKSEQDQKQDEKQKKEEKSEEKSDADEKKPEEKKDGQSQKKDEGDPQQSPAKDGKQDSQPGDKDGEKKPAPSEAPEQPEKKFSGEVKANPSQPQDQKEAQEEAAAEEQAAAEGKMTERQARALLDSLKNEDDHVRLVDPNERKRAGRPLRDW